MKKIYAGIGTRVLPSTIIWGDIRNVARNFKNKGWLLRSGGAIGSDMAFEDGALDKCEIFLPWKQLYTGRGIGIISSELENWNDAMKLAEKYHPAWDKLTNGVKALHSRNSYIILGKDLQSPVDMVFCYTKDGADVGGTGQGIRMARDLKIPVFNLFFENIKQQLLNY